MDLRPEYLFQSNKALSNVEGYKIITLCVAKIKPWFMVQINCGIKLAPKIISERSGVERTDTVAIDELL